MMKNVQPSSVITLHTVIQTNLDYNLTLKTKNLTSNSGPNENTKPLKQTNKPIKSNQKVPTTLN